MSIFIRAATPADAADLIRLRNMPAVRRGTLAIPYESVRERGGQLVAALAAPENMFLVACDGDELTGCASLHRARAAGRAHTASLGIMVADCWHGKGVGTALFAARTDLADRGTLLEERRGDSQPRERERGSEAADASAHDQNFLGSCHAPPALTRAVLKKRFALLCPDGPGSSAPIPPPGPAPRLLPALTNRPVP